MCEKKRTYSAEFKTKAVLEFLSGEATAGYSVPSSSLFKNVHMVY